MPASLVTSLTPPMRVLAIDHDRMVLASLRAMLRGIDVEATERVEEGVAWAAEHPVDVVISELRLSPFDGVAMLDRLPARLRRRVLYLTGGDVSEALARRASESGLEVMLKPVRRETLLAALERTMRAAAEAEPGGSLTARRGS